MRKRALMFPKVIKAAAGPHNLGSGSNYDESLPELMAQSSSSSGTGLDSSGGYMTDDYSSPVTNHEQELEVFHNPSSVFHHSSPLANPYSLFRKKTRLISSQIMSSE